MTDLSKFYCETNRKWFGYDRNTSSLFWTGVRKFTSPLPSSHSSLSVPFWPGLRALDEHPFSFNAFIYRPLLFLSTPSIPSHPLFLTPFLTPPIPSLLLFFSSFSFCSSPFSLLPSFSFVDTRLSRWFEEQSLHSPTSSAVFLLLFRRPLPLPPSRLIIRMIPLEHSSFRVFSHDWRWF